MNKRKSCFVVRGLVHSSSLLAIVLQIPPAAAHETVREVVENIKRNELLYKNIHINCRRTYKLNKNHLSRRPEDFDVQKTLIRKLHQGDKIYYQIEEHSTTVGLSNLQFLEECGYDGVLSRLVRSGEAANLSDRPVDHYYSRWVDPFHVLFEMQLDDLSLSAFLSGGPELRSARNYRICNLKTFLDSTEFVNGLRCLKLRVIAWRDGLKPEDVPASFLWVCPERNYLPVRWQWTNDKAMGNAFPELTADASDFREVAPGVWHPFLCVIRFYDHIDFKLNHKYSHVFESRYEFLNVDLDPHYPDSLFRDVKIPDGLPVYVLKGGEIVDSYVQGRVRTPAILKRHWKGLLPFAAVGFACVCLAWLARRRRRNSGRVLSADAPGGSK